MKTIPLTQGYFATVDDADYPAVLAHKWYAHRMGRRVYAERHIRRPDGSRTTQCLHQFLMPNAESVDHINGDERNNCRENLRAATTQQNTRGFQRKPIGTSSRFRGVGWHSRDLRWVSRIRVNGKLFHLGYFSVEESAARAYDAAAREHFGEFACPNFTT